MGRTPCCEKNGLKKGPWTSEEDQKLIDYIQKHGHGSWRTLPKNAGLARCGKSCRLRWTNYLRPDIKRGRFSFEEEETIIQLHSVLGNKWSAIAARLPGRTDNEIKNYWNTHIRKRLLRMGIDPVTHNPRLDHLDLSSLLTSSLYNPTTQFDVSGLLGSDPLVNIELLRFATNLLSSQCQNPNLVHQNIQQASFLQPYNGQFFNESSHIMQPQCNITDNYARAPNFSDQYNMPEHQWSEMPNNQGFDQSTAASSPTELNSSSTTYNINGSGIAEDERDSHCSDLFDFQIPDLLDVSELIM